MKIQSNHNSITFNAGLTSKMKSEIAHCDINKITKELAKSGISADFKNNKAVAWCSIKGIEIIKELNKKFNLNLAFPRGIYVEDFNNLLISDKMSAGFYNIAPKKLYMSNMGNTVVPQNVVFFNNFVRLRIENSHFPLYSRRSESHSGNFAAFAGVFRRFIGNVSLNFNDSFCFSLSRKK